MRSRCAASSATNPSVFGQVVSFTATVTATAADLPSGTVQFQVDGSNFGNPVALVNGTAAHALDYDDVTWGLIGHPSVSLVPAVLALGEHLGASGRDGSGRARIADTAYATETPNPTATSDHWMRR